MKFGIFLNTQCPPSDDMTVRFEELRQLVIAAREGGFASLWAGVHYATRPLQSLQPLPLLSRLAPDAAGMTLGTNILVLPFLNPLAVAEEAATMDLLTGGRYVLGVGLGYRDDEFTAFGIPKSERVGRFEEAIHVIRRLFSEEYVEHEGKFFKIPGIGLGLRPIHPGGPPIWIGATVDKAVERAARIGDGLPLEPYFTLAKLKHQVQVYLDALTAAGKGAPAEIPVIRECYISPAHSAALEECRVPLGTKYKSYSSWGQDSFLPAEDRFDQPLDQFMKDRFFIGDPQYLRDEIARYSEEIGADHYIFRVHWPGLPLEQAIRSVRLISEQVMPYVGAGRTNERRQATPA